MLTHRRLLVAGLVLVVGIAAGLTHFVVRAAETIPPRLSDQDFWRLSSDISEPNGFFQSDNLLSNEIWLQYVIPDLVKRTKPGGVYMGVGPEQNYTYIAALKPKMVFLPDIRRGNMDLQLMYKAIFELSADRADFVSLLFSKQRPKGLTTESSAADIFAAYDSVETGPDDVFTKNLKTIDDELTTTRHLPLSKDDLDGIEYVYDKFFMFGPQINYGSSQGNFRGGRGGFTNYADLMRATDAAGVDRSYLANEENFKYIKGLEERNMMVPVVGDLSGPKAVRAIGRYLKEHGATVEAFYLSNVEQYLQRNGTTNAFLCNVASLPLDDQSTFIRSQSGGGPPPGFGPSPGGFGGRGGGLMSFLGGMKDDVKRCSSVTRR
jgi:hypothetical protein